MTTLTLRYAPFAKIYVAKFTKSERIESSDVDKIEAVCNTFVVYYIQTPLWLTCSCNVGDRLGCGNLQG
jgi:uncharacterized membrane protein